MHQIFLSQVPAEARPCALHFWLRDGDRHYQPQACTVPSQRHGRLPIKLLVLGMTSQCVALHLRRRNSFLRTTQCATSNEKAAISSQRSRSLRKKAPDRRVHTLPSRRLLPQIRNGSHSLCPRGLNLDEPYHLPNFIHPGAVIYPRTFFLP